MVNLMGCSAQKLKAYEIEVDEKHEYEICKFALKNSYSYAQSQRVMRSLKHCRTRNHNKVYLRAYKCKRCNGWHLTSEKPFQYMEEKRIAKAMKTAIFAEQIP